MRQIGTCPKCGNPIYEHYDEGSTTSINPIPNIIRTCSCSPSEPTPSQLEAFRTALRELDRLLQELKDALKS